MSNKIDPKTGRFEPLDPREYFYDNLEKDEATGCWNWTGTMFDGGYGVFKCLAVQKMPMNASRGSWIVHNGPISRDIMVLHKCDNRRCVNPDHLFLGDGKDNMQDCSKKGRINRGEDRPQAKLTETAVREARILYASGYGPNAIADKFGVSPSAILFAVQRVTWKHVA